MRPAVERNDARIVRHLVHDRDVTGRLDDLQVAVVARLQPRNPEVDAALAERKHFRILERVCLAIFDLLRAPLLRRGGHRRNVSPRRIDDERGSSIVPIALDHPELVVVAGAGIVRPGLRNLVQHGEDEAVAELRVTVVLGDLRRERLQFRDFSLGEPFLAFPLLRALERRHGVVRPHAVKVRMSVSRA
jgi:hypothetical protein